MTSLSLRSSNSIFLPTNWICTPSAKEVSQSTGRDKFSTLTQYISSILSFSMERTTRRWDPSNVVPDPSPTRSWEKREPNFTTKANTANALSTMRGPCPSSDGLSTKKRSQSQPNSACPPLKSHPEVSSAMKNQWAQRCTSTFQIKTLRRVNRIRKTSSRSWLSNTNNSSSCTRTKMLSTSMEKTWLKRQTSIWGILFSFRSTWIWQPPIFTLTTSRWHFRLFKMVSSFRKRCPNYTWGKLKLYALIKAQTWRCSSWLRFVLRRQSGCAVRRKSSRTPTKTYWRWLTSMTLSKSTAKPLVRSMKGLLNLLNPSLSTSYQSKPVSPASTEMKNKSLSRARPPRKAAIKNFYLRHQSIRLSWECTTSTWGCSISTPKQKIRSK